MNSYSIPGKTIALTSSFHESNFTWKYGDLRGGTPAIKINNSFYLSFFHSSNDPPESGENVLKTYVMGAYTFCINPPFKILRISSQPIIHNTMYNSSWPYLPISYYHIDYIVFPMSFVYNTDYIYLLYGKQDNSNFRE